VVIFVTEILYIVHYLWIDITCFSRGHLRPPLCPVHLKTVADSVVSVMLRGVFNTVGQRIVSEISITTESLQLVISSHAQLMLILYRLRLL
jgi:hypothetical protein